MINNISLDDIRKIVKTHDTPLLVTSLDIVSENYIKLKEALHNNVELYYAMKPFPHERVVDKLYSIGSNFDVATTGEIKLLKKINVTPSRCIHTHPIKRDKDIKAALKFGINQFVVDNISEIDKFIKYKKKVKLFLRISFRNSEASVDLSKKFGCTPDSASTLIEYARNKGIHVNGLSFHVGSQCKSSKRHVEAIHKCNEIIAETIIKGFPEIKFLDIGGGFPAWYGEGDKICINDFCKPINEALSRIPTHIKIIAEPGRFIVASATISISSIMGKAFRDGKFWYYLDDGVYGSYSDHIFDNVRNPISIITNNNSTETHLSVLAGSTCDSIDVIREEILLPELDIGDLIIGETMGAYTWATSTNFNFFDRAKLIFI